MRLRVAAALIPAVLATAPSVASARDVLSGPQEITFLNAQRSANGIPGDVVENPTLTANCATHMAYIAAHDGGALVHEEDPTQPDYTEAGNSAGRNSVLTSAGSAFTASGANLFETAPIHLMQMLSPWLVSSGASGGCLDTLSDHSRGFAAATTFSYPGDGSTSVATSEKAFEGPFVPGDFVGLPMGTTTGPNLLFYYAGPSAPNSVQGAYFDSRGHFTAATLTGPSGPVDIRTVDGNTTAAGLQPIGPFMPPGGIVIPVSPLVANQKYTASVTFQPDADADANGIPDLPAVTRTWSFSSGKVAPPPTTPVPTVPKRPPLPVKPILTKLVLKSRSVSITSTTSASLWVTIDQQVRKAHSRKTTWKLRRSVPLPTTANIRARVVLNKLTKGRYRVKIHTGTAAGAVLLTSTTTLR